MNNNYFNIPNADLMRNVPFSQVAPFRNTSLLPRFSSLLRTSPVAASGIASTSSKITFSSILNGASKTLGVINQAIPVFYQVKPIWNNARTMFKVVKEINSNSNTDETNKKSELKTPKKEESNAPTFFI